MNQSPNKNDGRFPFTRLEEQLQTWIEDRFASLFEGVVKPAMLLRRLAKTLENHNRIKPATTGAIPLFASLPDIFIVSLNPKNLTPLLETYPDIQKQLAKQLTQLALDAQLRITFPIQVSLLEDETVSPRQIKIDVQYSLESVGGTQKIISTPVPTVNNNLQPPYNAELVLPDGRHISLNRPVMNIGRNPDNHIILEDRRISRQHCQLRLRFGVYILYDLQSKGGTFVNKERIYEHRLQKGDLISLGGVNILYLDDVETLRHEGDTETPPSRSTSQKRDTLVYPVIDDIDNEDSGDITL
jgi:pSer/pThr/pTyr-binding forkhead associated (FHA) protein